LLTFRWSSRRSIPAWILLRARWSRSERGTCRTVA